jgi:YVTN family beta-propeller protein
MKYIIGTILAMSLLFACSQKENIINPIDDKEKILIATEGDNPKLKILEIPSLVEINSDILGNSLGLNIKSQIECVREFGGNLFVLVPGDNKILVIRKLDLSQIVTIDFTADKTEPVDIIFPNSTDAYIIHKNSIYVTLLDITNFIVAKNITVGNPPHSIAIAGNQVFVTNQPDNTVSIIDTRDRREVAKIQTDFLPTFVKISPDEKSAIVICVGKGKIVESEDKTDAVVQFIDIEKREIYKSLPLGFAQINPSEQFPQSFIVTPKDWGFVATKDNFMRIDLRYKDKINLVTKRNFKYLNIDNKDNKLILLLDKDSGTDIMYADDRSGEIDDIYNLPYIIKFVMPY